MARAQDGGVDPRFDPQFQRGYDPKRHRPPAVEPVETEPEPVEPEPVDTPADDTSALEASAPAPRLNPFRLALLLASIASIGGGALVVWKRVTEDPYYYGVGFDVTETFVHQLVDALLVPLLTGGLLGLCIWLALGALRPRRGPRAER